MMQLVKYPARDTWRSILQRPVADRKELFRSVDAILQNVKTNGDSAIRNYIFEYDNCILENFEVTDKEFVKAAASISDDLKEAINIAATNIKAYHQVQLRPAEVIETAQGIQTWQKSAPIEKVGLYIPGGTAPLFSTLLMLGIPALIAGCKEIIVCTPPDKSGKVHPSVLYTASLLGITSVLKIGGAQAIAAMAYGTASVPQVYKIFGPGNQYVTAAKQLVQVDGIAIDMPAGPSEVCILADESAEPSFVAADLLSQAEHGTDSQVMLITTSGSLIENVSTEIAIQASKLSRISILEKSLAKSKAILVKNIIEGVGLVNEYAPEHLVIACENADSIAGSIINAGSVFIGNYSPESAGDYASGTNHTLPTNGFAKAFSGVTVDSFMKKISFQKLTKQGLSNLANTIITMAEAEGLDAHANAVKIRSDV
jgi:histidinol dehydrogenase